MKICKSILILFINLISSYSYEQQSYRVGFGSCLNQNKPQEIWNAIKKENIQSFFFLGDNVYGDDDNEDLKNLKMAYEIQKTKLPNWLNNIEIMSIWDDHDFGKNDAGKDYQLKEKSKEIFFDFWTSYGAEFNVENQTYFSKLVEIKSKKILFLGLDTRFYRSKLIGKSGSYIKNDDNSATILGKDQWFWLENELSKKVDFIVLGSSIQVLPLDHGWEKWGNFENERNRLLKLIKDIDINCLIISGDRHRAGIYKFQEIYEVTSSSLNMSFSKNEEIDKYSIEKTYPEENFGILEFNETYCNFSIHNKSGELINEGKLNY
jgi:alkaline phosphatase D